jgi:hypothetical protein
MDYWKSEGVDMDWKRFGYEVMPAVLGALIAAVIGVVVIGLTVLLDLA